MGLHSSSRNAVLLWALAMLVLGLPSARLAAQSTPVFHVAPDGSDLLGDGSPAAPWATISAAVRNAPASGGLVLVHDGVYRGNVAIGRKFTGLLTVRAEHPYRAILRNDNAQTLSIWDAANVIVTGFDILRGNPQTPSPTCAQIARSESIALIDNLIHDSSYDDVLKINEAPRNLLIMGNIFYNQQGSSGQHMDVNGAVDVTIRDNIFFNHTTGTGVDGSQTHGFVVVKNSGSLPESRRIHITSNVFLNWEGGPGSNFVLVGEDGKPFHEAQDVLVENNLMIGNSPILMRAPLGIKGARDVTFRNNTITGDLPASAYATRLIREGANPRILSIYFFNNIWSDPTGTMKNFSDGVRRDSVDVRLENNLYWNGGMPIPGGQMLAYTDDPRAIVADPLLPAPSDVVLPQWTGDGFPSGSVSIRQEFERLARLYGVPAAQSPILGRSDPATSPGRDLLDRARGGQPDLGAMQPGAPEPSSLRVVLAPQAVVGGGATTLNQIVLEAAGEAVSVRLSSSDPELVSVPETVEIPSGSTTGAFRLTTSPVDSTRQVTITAALGEATTDPESVPAPETGEIPDGSASGGFRLTNSPLGSIRRVTVTAAPGEVTAESTLTLLPAGLRSVNLGADTLMAGTDSTRNLVLYDGTAGPEGILVHLVSSRPDLVIVPETVTIAAGKSYSEYFPVSTRATPETTVVTIAATLGSSQVTADLTLTPAPFQVTFPQMTSDASSTNCQVVLDTQAPLGGALVQLSSSNPAVLWVPETITVEETRNIAAFRVQTGSLDSTVNVTVTASYGGKSASATRSVIPMEPYGVSAPASIVAGTTATVTVTLIARPANDLPLDIVLPPDAPLEAPATVVVPAGGWGAYFKVTARSVPGPTETSITVAYRGRSRSAKVLVRLPQLQAFYVPPTITGGTANVFTLSLEGPAPEGGATIALVSLEPEVLGLPPEITVPAGATSVRSTLSPVPVPAPVEVKLQATYGVTKSATLAVLPAALSAVVVSPNPQVGGVTSTLNYIRLSGPAPPDGFVVSLSSSNPALVSVPESVRVPAGTSWSWTPFTITSVAVSEAVPVTITGSAAGVTKAATLTLQPAFALASVSVPPTLTSGQPASVVVKLIGAAPAGGVTVALSSSRPDVVEVPQAIAVAAGAVSAEFTIGPSTVSGPTPVTISASAAGITKTAVTSVVPGG